MTRYWTRPSRCPRGLRWNWKTHVCVLFGLAVAACTPSPRARVESMLTALQRGSSVDEYWLGTPAAELRGEISGFTLKGESPRGDYERARLTELLKVKRDTLETVREGLLAHRPSWLTEADADWL